MPANLTKDLHEASYNGSYTCCSQAFVYIFGVVLYIYVADVAP